MSKIETTLVCPCCQRSDRLERVETTDDPNWNKEVSQLGELTHWWCDRCNGWMSSLPPTAQHPDLPKRGTRKRRGT